ncbi:MAG: TrbI/VirB10 family protein [Terracidiphilus sp.]|jgi:type IV secretion system protein VirB10
MIKPDENPKPVNPEGAHEESQEEILEAAQTDKVVRGVNGSLTPKARKLRPLAGIILIALVLLAAAYMRHGLANRHKKTVKQADTEKVGAGPATTVEKGLLSDQARSGLNTGQSHVPDSSALRTSILTGETPTGRSTQPAANSSQTTSIPPLEYRQTPVSTAASGSLSFAEQRRLDEYNREREAMEAPTSVKGNLASNDKETSTAASDPLAAIQSALLNARSMLGTGSGGSTPSTLAQSGIPGTPEQRSDYERQNDQVQKTAFGQQHSKQETEYLTATRQPAQGQNEVKAGWLIPAVLEQQLNSDLPGMIRALVRENIYDSATGRYILIPAGSTLIGIYNSNVGYGQNALQAVWQRVVFPDGSSLALGGFEGDSSAGAAGFRDQVNNHWGRILSGALLTSIFAAGIEVSQGTNSSVLQSQSVGQTVGQAVGQQVGELGTEVTRRNLNIQPTIVVRPGYRFFVRVEKDIQFSGPYAPLTAASGRSSRAVAGIGRGASDSQENSQKESNSQGEP